MTHLTRPMLRPSDRRQAQDSICRSIVHHSSLQMSVGMSEPEVVHQLQVVRVARYVLQHPEETWLFNYQADPKALYVYTDTEWAADELTRKSVSCTVERYGSHMFDCSVAKQSLVPLSSREAEFYGIVRAVGRQSKPHRSRSRSGCNSSDSSAARGICTRTGSGKVRHLSIKELGLQEAYRKKEFQLVSVDTLLNWADTGTKAHTSERLTSLLRQMPLRLREGQTKALACHAVMNA